MAVVVQFCMQLDGALVYCRTANHDLSDFHRTQFNIFKIKA